MCLEPFGDYDIVHPGRFWPVRVHTVTKWTYLGSFKIEGLKLDFYKHKHPEQYGGISAQYGEEECEYCSNGHIYEDRVPVSPVDAMFLALGLAEGLTKKYV